MLKIAPINDPIIAKFLTVKNAATLQEPKQPEAKKKYPDDLSMSGFGFVRRPETGQWVSKGVYDEEQKAKLEAERAQQPQPAPVTKKRKGLFSHDK